MYNGVKRAVNESFKTVCKGRGFISCRITHAYPDGCAPYFTVICEGSGSLKDRQHQFLTIKRAASDALLNNHATATHHHSVGSYHQPWYLKEVGSVYVESLSALKRQLDPHWILNPSILLPIPFPAHNSHNLLTSSQLPSESSSVSVTHQDSALVAQSKL